MYFINQDFESGKFEKTRKKRRSKKETTKHVYTYDQLQTMLRAGAFKEAKFSSSDDDDDNEKEEEGDVSNKSKEDPIFNLRKTTLNFNYVFREYSEEEKLKYGDLTGDDYFIEEDFEEVNLPEDFNVCEQLMKEAEYMAVDVNDINDDDTFLVSQSEMNPELVRLIKGIDDCFAEKATQKESKLKRARMQSQTTNNEEPDSKY
jgi:hypothetical protein